MPTYYSPSFGASRYGSATAVEQDERLKFAYADFVNHDVAGQGILKLIWLPYRDIIIHPRLSTFGSSAYTASADIHLGVRYVNPDTDVEVYAPTLWLDNVDGGSAQTVNQWGQVTGVVAGGLVPAANRFHTKNGLAIEAMVDTADMPLNGTLYVGVFYSTI